MLKSNKKNKKAVSVIVSYVLLISITLSLSVLVFNWLKFNVNVGDDVSCDDNVAIAIKNFSYDAFNNKLNLTISNDGMFNIDGFYVRANDNSNLNISDVLLDNYGKEIKVGDSREMSYNASKDYNGGSVGDTLFFVEVQPFIIKDAVKVLCKNAVVKREISTGSGR